MGEAASYLSHRTLTTVDLLHWSMESSGKVQEQATRVKMGVNDLAIHFIARILAEEPGLMVFWMSIFKASW
jgi:hypothetical protein